MTLSAWARDDELLDPGMSLGGVSNLMKIKGTSPRSFGKKKIGIILLLLLLLFVVCCCCFCCFCLLLGVCFGFFLNLGTIFR